MTENCKEKKVGQAIMPSAVKKLVAKVYMKYVTCTYEGCGGDDGWPA